MSRDHRPFLQTGAWRRIRRAIIQRDYGRCRSCESPNRLEVHHVHGIAEGGEELVPPELLITLCQKCHQLAHGKGGPKTPWADWDRLFDADTG